MSWQQLSDEIAPCSADMQCTVLLQIQCGNTEACIQVQHALEAQVQHALQAQVQNALEAQVTSLSPLLEALQS